MRLQAPQADADETADELRRSNQTRGVRKRTAP
jgi:hypothetical protein